MSTVTKVAPNLAQAGVNPPLIQQYMDTNKRLHENVKSVPRDDREDASLAVHRRNEANKDRAAKEGNQIFSSGLDQNIEATKRLTETLAGEQFQKNAGAVREYERTQKVKDISTVGNAEVDLENRRGWNKAQQDIYKDRLITPDQVQDERARLINDERRKYNLGVDESNFKRNMEAATFNEANRRYNEEAFKRSSSSSSSPVSGSPAQSYSNAIQQYQRMQPQDDYLQKQVMQSQIHLNNMQAAKLLYPTR